MSELPLETVGVTDLLRRLRPPVLSTSALGTVVETIAEWRLHSSRSMVVKLLHESGLEDLLIDDEFLNSLGHVRPKTKQLLRIAYREPRSPGAALELIGRFASAGLLNVFSRSATRELNRLLQRWPQLELRRELISHLVSEMETLGEMGLFLSQLFNSTASKMTRTEIAELLRAVLSSPDVSSLEGTPADLIAHLPEHAELCDSSLIKFEAESDADSDGNLAGFVARDSSPSMSESSCSVAESSRSHSRCDSPLTANFNCRGSADISGPGQQKRRRLRKYA